MAIWLNGIFKDNMVFQWGAELRVFGRSDKPCTVRCALFKEDESILLTIFVLPGCQGKTAVSLSAQIRLMNPADLMNS